MTKFSFLESFINTPMKPADNVFFPVKQQNIDEAEKLLGYALPAPLIEFYSEIGYGFLQASENRRVVNDSDINRIIDPVSVSELILGISELQPTEQFDSGDIPFFEIGDELFIVMKTKAKKANTIFLAHGERMIAENLEEFIRKLYFECPDFYKAFY